MIDKLKDYREGHNLSLEALAGKLGVSWSTVQRWLKGKSEPSKLAQDRIANLLRKK